MQLRHYKSLGLDYVLARTHALAGRLNEEDRARGWSAHYLRDDDSIRAHFEKQLAQAEPIPAPPPLPKEKKKKAPKKRWWQRR